MAVNETASKPARLPAIQQKASRAMRERELSKNREERRARPRIGRIGDWEDLKHLAFNVIAKAVNDRNLRELQNASAVLEGMIQIEDLLAAFSDCDGRIRGTSGVADVLEISRNAVYVRLEMVGLDPHDFRELASGDFKDLDTNAFALVASSKKLRSRIDRLLNYPAAVRNREVLARRRD
jgi:hypothetical protein